MRQSSANPPGLRDAGSESRASARERERRRRGAGSDAGAVLRIISVLRRTRGPPGAPPVATSMKRQPGTRLLPGGDLKPDISWKGQSRRSK